MWSEEELSAAFDEQEAEEQAPEPEYANWKDAIGSRLALTWPVVKRAAGSGIDLLQGALGVEKDDPGVSVWGEDVIADANRQEKYLRDNYPLKPSLYSSALEATPYLIPSLATGFAGAARAIPGVVGGLSGSSLYGEFRDKGASRTDAAIGALPNATITTASAALIPGVGSKASSGLLKGFALPVAGEMLSATPETIAEVAGRAYATGEGTTPEELASLIQDRTIQAGVMSAGIGTANKLLSKTPASNEVISEVDFQQKLLNGEFEPGTIEVSNTQELPSAPKVDKESISQVRKEVFDSREARSEVVKVEPGKPLPESKKNPIEEIENQKLAATREQEKLLPPEEPETKFISDIDEVKPEDGEVVPVPQLERQYQVQRISTKEIKVDPELMQYKASDDPVTGVNARDEIQGQWDDLKAGTLTLFEPLAENRGKYGLAQNQKYILADGHHRLDGANKRKVPSVNTIILKEAYGVSPQEARSLAAETNIIQKRGTDVDQVKFLRNQTDTFGKDAAMARARQIGLTGRHVASIAHEASPEVYTSFINQRLNTEQASAISKIGAGDYALQQAGLKLVQRDSSIKPIDLKNRLQVELGRTNDAVNNGAQVDMFTTYSDAAWKQIEQAGDTATIWQKYLQNKIRSVEGAAKDPSTAKSLGVDVNNPEAVKAEINTIREELGRWNEFHKHAELRKAANKGVLPPELIESLTPEGAAKNLSNELNNKLENLYTKDANGKIKVDPGLFDAVETIAERAGYKILDSEKGVRPTFKKIKEDLGLTTVEGINVKDSSTDVQKTLGGVSGKIKQWISTQLALSEQQPKYQPVFEGTLEGVKIADQQISLMGSKAMPFFNLPESSQIKVSQFLYKANDLGIEKFGITENNARKFGLKEQEIKAALSVPQLFNYSWDTLQRGYTNSKDFVFKTAEEFINKKELPDKPQTFPSQVDYLREEKINLDTKKKDFPTKRKEIAQLEARINKVFQTAESLGIPIEAIDQKLVSRISGSIDPQEIEAVALAAQRTVEWKAQVKNFFGARYQENYVPKFRDGQYPIMAKNPLTGEQEFYLESSRSSQNLKARELIDKGYRPSDIEVDKNPIVSSDELINTLPIDLQIGLNDLDPDAFHEMGQRVGVRGFSKHFYRAKGIKGYKENIKEGLVDYINGMGNMIAKLETDKGINRAMAEIDPVNEVGLLKHATQYRESMYKKNSVVSLIRKVTTPYYLGDVMTGNLKTPFVNATQPFTMTLPIMKEYTTNAKANQYWKSAYSKGLTYLRNPDKFFQQDPSLFLAMKNADQRGLLGGKEYEGYKKAAINPTLVDTTIEKMMWLNSMTESMNRTHAFISGWDVATKDLKLKGEERYKFVERFVERTQVIQNKANRPKIAWGAGALGFTFRNFQWNWWRELNSQGKKKGYNPLTNPVMRKMLVSAGLLGGYKAIPGLKDIENLLKSQGFDPDTDAREELQNIFGEYYGSKGHDFLSGGIPAVLGFNISGSLSMLELSPQQRENIFMALGRVVLGAPGDMFIERPFYRAPNAYNEMNGTHLERLWRAGETLLPEGMRSRTIAARSYNDGYWSNNKGTPIVLNEDGSAAEPEFTDLALKGTNFTPQTLNNSYKRQQSLEVLRQNKIKAQEMFSNATYGRLKALGDFESIRLIDEALDEYNSSLPKGSPYRVKKNSTAITKAKKNFKNPGEAEIHRLPKALREEGRRRQSLYK